MKPVYAILTAVGALYSFGSFGLATRCELTYNLRTAGIILEAGGGTGMVTCWNKDGTAAQMPVTLTLPFTSIGFQAGACNIQGHVSLRAPKGSSGFTRDQVFGLLGQSQVKSAGSGQCSKPEPADRGALRAVAQTCFSPGSACGEALSGSEIIVAQASDRWIRTVTPSPNGQVFRPHLVPQVNNKDGSITYSHFEFAPVAVNKTPAPDAPAPVAKGKPSDNVAIDNPAPAAPPAAVN